MLIAVPFVLAGIFRYQLLGDPEETKRRSSISDQTGKNRKILPVIVASNDFTQVVDHNDGNRCVRLHPLMTSQVKQHIAVFDVDSTLLVATSSCTLLGWPGPAKSRWLLFLLVCPG